MSMLIPQLCKDGDLKLGRSVIDFNNPHHAKLEITVFAELWDQHRHAIKVDDPLIVCAKIENDEFSGGYRGAASEILTLGNARARFSLGLRLKLTKAESTDTAAPAVTARLKALLEPWRDARLGCPLMLRLHRAGAECDIALPEGWRVRPEEDLIAALTEHFSPDAVEVMYR